ncbi:hypothetical protein AJ87_10830 [Rhizobium yanglingense]|nr:hypothetical protein AJ87_10830 [Rhizobium yanglingense]
MTNPLATVLVVGDKVCSIEAIQRVLSDEFEVIGARNAKEAEDVLEGEMVQVILCDQRMPGDSRKCPEQLKRGHSRGDRRTSAHGGTGGGLVRKFRLRHRGRLAGLLRDRRARPYS